MRRTFLTMSDVYWRAEALLGLVGFGVHEVLADSSSPSEPISVRKLQTLSWRFRIVKALPSPGAPPRRRQNELARPCGSIRSPTRTA